MSQVVIGDILPYTQAVAILNQTIFGTNWTANAFSDVVVYVTPFGDAPDDFTQILQYPADYSVIFLGAELEVQVTLVTPSGAGDIVTITRQTPADRMNLYTNTNFLPTMLNNDFGILTLVDQQAQLVNQLIGPRYNYSAIIIDVIDTILPILGENETWVKNSNNTAIIPYTLPTSGIAPADDTYITLTDETATLPNSVNFAGLEAGLTIFTGTGFITNPVDGTTNEINVANPTGVSGPITISIANNAVIPGTAGMGIPAGTTGQRVTPTAPSIGFRYNTTIDSVEYFGLDGWTQLIDNNDGIILPGLQNDLAYYAANGSILSPLTTANNSVLITSAGGVPSLSTVLPGGLTTTDPVVSQGLATKNYVDTTALNGTSVYAASAATLGTVTQSGAGVGATITNAGTQAVFSIDGVNPPVGVNVLIKNTATGMTSANEGIYTVTNAGSVSTNWVLTRATSYDTALEINETGLILVQNGTTLIGTAWYNAATIVTVDTTAFSYSQFGNITFPVSLNHGGTSASLVAVNGGVVYSNATAMAISAAGLTGQIFQSNGAAAPTWSTPTYPSLSGTTGKLIISDGTNNVYSTTTWPNTFVINTIPYASSANIIGAISAVNSAVLISSAGGVPSMSTTLPANLTIPSPKITTGIFDINGNEILGLSAVSSAVNYVSISNSATGSALSIGAVGTDTNITMSTSGKGNGGTQRQGLMTGGVYSTGFSGSMFTSNIPTSSAISLTNNTAKDITSVTVGPGVWDIYGNVFFTASVGFSAIQVWTSLTSATNPDSSKITAINGLAATYGGLAAPYLSISVSANTTVYLSCLASFSAGTVSGCGTLTAVMR